MSNMEKGGGCLAYDIRVFIQENADCKTYERFKKENQLDKQTEENQGG